MGVEEEEGCHTDMHKLEGREIWTGLLRKPWWHNTGEKGKEAGFYVLVVVVDLKKNFFFS